MKWNWGAGIFLSFVLFCAFIITMVSRAFQQDISLVSESYYQEELAYESRIQDIANFERNGTAVNIKQTDQSVILTYPESFQGANGTIHFYHPSKKILDQVYEMEIRDKSQIIDKSKIAKGRYKVKMSWEVSEVGYYHEQEIFIQ